MKIDFNNRATRSVWHNYKLNYSHPPPLTTHEGRLKVFYVMNIRNIFAQFLIATHRMKMGTGLFTFVPIGEQFDGW